MAKLSDEMTEILEQERAKQRKPIAWWMTEAKADELRRNLGDPACVGRPVEFLGLPVQIYPGVEEIGGWGLNTTA